VAIPRILSIISAQVPNTSRCRNSRKINIYQKIKKNKKLKIKKWKMENGKWKMENGKFIIIYILKKK
jgi:hypothetical protein